MTGESLRVVSIDALEPGQEQPRRTAPREGRQERLTESVRTNGVLQPLLVRPLAGGRYRIVAGERRYLAAREAGLAEVPCAVRELSDPEALTLALVENVQREDLTDLDKSDALRALREQTGLPWSELARLAGLSAERVRQLAGLQALTPEVKEALRARRISGRVAAALRPLPPGGQMELLEEALAQELSADEVRALAAEWQARGTAPREELCSARATRRHPAVRKAARLADALVEDAPSFTPDERQELRAVLARVLEAIG